MELCRCNRQKVLCQTLWLVIILKYKSFSRTVILFLQCFGSGSALIWLFWIRIWIRMVNAAGSRSKEVDENQQINLISNLSKWLLYKRTNIPEPKQ
jgi:hypothetical protein